MLDKMFIWAESSSAICWGWLTKSSPYKIVNTEPTKDAVKPQATISTIRAFISSLVKRLPGFISIYRLCRIVVPVSLLLFLRLRLTPCFLYVVHK
jgi:hypothetical protein